MFGQAEVPWPSNVPVPVRTNPSIRLNTTHSGVVYTFRLVEASKVPSIWIVMEVAPLHGPPNLIGPVRYDPFGIVSVGVPVAAQTAFQAASNACKITNMKE